MVMECPAKVVEFQEPALWEGSVLLYDNAQVNIQPWCVCCLICICNSRIRSQNYIYHLCCDVAEQCTLALPASFSQDCDMFERESRLELGTTWKWLLTDGLRGSCNLLWTDARILMWSVATGCIRRWWSHHEPSPAIKCWCGIFWMQERFHQLDIRTQNAPLRTIWNLV